MPQSPPANWCSAGSFKKSEDTKLCLDHQPAASPSFILPCDEQCFFSSMGLGILLISKFSQHTEHPCKNGMMYSAAQM